MLTLMLTVGNFLNCGTNRGGAFGIKLKTLSKFNDTKDNKGKTVLFNIYSIAQGMQKNPNEKMSEYLNKLREDPTTTDLEYQTEKDYYLFAMDQFVALCARCRKTSFPDESDVFEKFQRHLEQIKKTIDQFDCGPKDQYKRIMQRFVDTAELQVEKLAQSNKEIKEKIERAKKLYSEPNSVSFEEFIQHFYNFADACE